MRGRLRLTELHHPSNCYPHGWSLTSLYWVWSHPCCTWEELRPGHLEMDGLQCALSCSSPFRWKKAKIWTIPGLSLARSRVQVRTCERSLLVCKQWEWDGSQIYSCITLQCHCRSSFLKISAFFSRHTKEVTNVYMWKLEIYIFTEDILSEGDPILKEMPEIIGKRIFLDVDPSFGKSLD